MDLTTEEIDAGLLQSAQAPNEHGHQESTCYHYCTSYDLPAGWAPTPYPWATHTRTPTPSTTPSNTRSSTRTFTPTSTPASNAAKWILGDMGASCDNVCSSYGWQCNAASWAAASLTAIASEVGITCYDTLETETGPSSIATTYLPGAFSETVEEYDISYQRDEVGMLWTCQTITPTTLTTCSASESYWQRFCPCVLDVQVPLLPPGTSWVLGSPDGNCNDACTIQGLACSTSGVVWPDAGNVGALATALGVECRSLEPSSLDNKPVGYSSSSEAGYGPKYCVYADTYAASHSDYPCYAGSTIASDGLQRFCPCISATSTPSATSSPVPSYDAAAADPCFEYTPVFDLNRALTRNYLGAVSFLVAGWYRFAGVEYGNSGGVPFYFLPSSDSDLLDCTIKPALQVVGLHPLVPGEVSFMWLRSLCATGPWNPTGWLAEGISVKNCGGFFGKWGRGRLRACVQFVVPIRRIPACPCMQIVVLLAVVLACAPSSALCNALSCAPVPCAYAVYNLTSAGPAIDAGLAFYACSTTPAQWVPKAYPWTPTPTASIAATSTPVGLTATPSITASYEGFAADPCFNYVVLDDPSREETNGGAFNDDSAVSYAWYRVQDGNFAYISSTPVPPNSCGAETAVYLVGQYPLIPGGLATVNSQAQAINPDLPGYNYAERVKNCGGYLGAGTWI